MLGGRTFDTDEMYLLFVEAQNKLVGLTRMSTERVH